MFKTLKSAFQVKEVRRKILLTLLLLLIYRIGCWLPIPGINVELFQNAVVNESSGFLNLLSTISGGALSNGAFLALGVSPYITASIVIQLLGVAIPALQRIAKEGTEESRKKISFYTRICALVLAIAQATGIAIAYSGNVDTNILWSGAPQWVGCIVIALVLTAGGMFTVWLGEKITELGIGNGLSLLIFVGILSSAGTALLSAVQNIANDINYIWTLLIFLAGVIVVFGLIVFVDSGERRVPVHYAGGQQRGRRQVGKQTSYIPMKVNSSGVMPIIFASALLTFPQLLISIFWKDALNWYSTYLGAGSWAYIVLTSLAIVAFSFFYSQMTFSPEDVSRQIQQNGGQIQGIKQGKPTADYLRRIHTRLITIDAIYLAFISLIPGLIFNAIGGGNATLVNAFSVTGLMIIVSTALETNKQLEAQLYMRNYRGFLK